MPQPVYKQLITDLTLQVGAGRFKYSFTFPKGTRCKRITEGDVIGKYWVADLSTIPNDHIAKHDAVHYGIIVEPTEVA